MPDREPEPWETTAEAAFLRLERARGTVEVWALGGDRFAVGAPRHEEVVVGFDEARARAHALADEVFDTARRNPIASRRSASQRGRSWGDTKAHLRHDCEARGSSMKAWKARRVLVAAAVGAALLALTGSAIGAGGKGPAKAKLSIKGRDSFKPNAYLKFGEFFAPGTVTIRSGGTVTLTNTTDGPHTLSIVKPSQRPRALEQVENCGACGPILASHGINPEGPPAQGPPPHPLVDAGAAGFDTAGDSTVIGPKGSPHAQVAFKVTARPGTTLSFICAIHPWMQGRFLVK